MTLQAYLAKLNTLYITGNAREHSYRGDLQNLLHALLPDVLVTNEPARVACGAPDYVLTRKDIPVGYIEAKDIGVDLNSKTLKEQFDRYKEGLPNIIFTDYLDFHFYKDATLTTKITIGKIENGKIVAVPENFERFEQLIINFAQTVTQTIKSPTRLAEMMAGRAKLMADIIEKSLNNDDENDRDSNLKSQMLSFQDMLIHDIDNKAFADIYAQTIAYGMFAARYHDPTLPTFSREEAATLIPKSNPFLRKLFQDIAGYDVDTRLVWIVEELVHIFLATDVAKIMKNFGKATKQEDPVIHFYETFLGAYNKELKIQRGVWYTPQPVVSFIVRAVDDILKTEFELKGGLADTSKTKIKVKIPKLDERSKQKAKVIGEQFTEKEVHKVQILDPATGTGTFLAEVVRHIHKKFVDQKGIWNQYVNKDLIPRLNGFELLMASYAMAHLKMDMLLTETGYTPTDDQRFRIYLTNSLEEYHKDTGTIFSNWLADEANQANAIKRDTPVMVIIGNPPYSGESSNKSEWIMNLMKDYKTEPGGNIRLKEKNSKFINSDEYKFIRFGQHFIDKNGEGILAFINPHGYLDNPTFRGMRWNLLKTFDKIYTIDLHGNSTKKETAPDGSVDQNVFDIMQGVSINIFVKTGKKEKNDLGKVYHHEIYGKRKEKYAFLDANHLNNIPFVNVDLKIPEYFFIPKNLESKDEIEFKLSELFPVNSLGLLTKRDNLVIDVYENTLKNKILSFLDINKSTAIACKEFNLLIKDNDKWDANIARNAINLNDVNDYIKKFTYRPFDNRFIFYNPSFIARPNVKVLGNFQQSNVALISGRQGQAVGSMPWNLSFISNNLSDQNIYYRGGGTVFPLYIYKNDNQLSTEGEIRTPNLNPEILNQIAKGLDLEFIPEKETEGEVCFANSTDVRPEFRNTFAPIDLLDYIYAVLHSPTYREKYKEYLKIDFPRVPYPTETDKFWELVKLGGELRQIHLLESDVVEKYITKYPEDGNNIVEKPRFELEPSLRGTEQSLKTDDTIEDDGKIAALRSTPLAMTGRVYINETQYFDNVPEVAWNFYIGGYQPAQKWLKDRKGRELSYEDIFHYQKIIVALTKTDRIMKEIDKIEI